MRNRGGPASHFGGNDAVLAGDRPATPFLRTHYHVTPHFWLTIKTKSHDNHLDRNKSFLRFQFFYLTYTFTVTMSTQHPGPSGSAIDSEAQRNPVSPASGSAFYRLYTHPWFQIILIGVICFCCPGVGHLQTPL